MISNIRNLVRSKVSDQTKEQRLMQKIDLSSEYAKKFSVGNCEEQAAVAFCYFKSLSRRPRVEYFAIKNHVFLVLGRDPTTPSSDPSQWNDTACVCDPWVGDDGDVYPVHQIESRLRDWAGLDQYMNPILIPLDQGNVPILLASIEAFRP